MSTKLEAMIDHLAGREGEPGILDELADPSSEASRFLEATRARSKALLEAPEVPGTSIRNSETRRTSRATLVLIALVMLLLLGLASWLADARFRGMEAAFARSEASSVDMVKKLEEALARLSQPVPAPASPSAMDAAIGRVEADFRRLEQRLEAPDPNAVPAKVDPLLGQLREDLITLRRDISSVEKTRTRQAEELLSSIHEVNRVLRLLLNRTQPPASTETPQPPGLPQNRPSSPGERGRIDP